MNANEMKDITFLEMINCTFSYLSDEQQAIFATAISGLAAKRLARERQLPHLLALPSDQGGAK